jgi:hypothetical protein
MNLQISAVTLGVKDLEELRSTLALLGAMS